MDDTKWLRWLRTLTREDSVRGIARATGKSHTTVQRWIVKGVPPDTVWELTLRFNGDPLLALVLLDRVAPDRITDLNFAAIVRHAPEQTLTSELHRRAVERSLVTLPARSDVISRKSFRITSKCQ